MQPEQQTVRRKVGYAYAGHLPEKDKRSIKNLKIQA
jgi:hypothetical protein